MDKNTGTVVEKRGGSQKIIKNLKKYDKGEGVRFNQIQNKTMKIAMKKKEDKFTEAQETTARAEILLTEHSGLLETAKTVHSSEITQRQIRQAVDITAATKMFNLSLTDFGPYKLNYSDNGRHIVLGGRKGHLFALDWVTKKLAFELNVDESIHSVQYLHNEEMIAVAQKKWTYIYDNHGVELHCLKQLYDVFKLEFLRHHFLLCSLSTQGWLSWLDVSLGEEIIRTYTRKTGDIKSMCQNPSNAVLCCAHSKGTVTMWTPNCKEPVFQMLCHPAAIQDIAFSSTGQFFATAGIDRLLRVWDVRNLGKNLSSFHVKSISENICFSQSNLLAASFGKEVQIFRDVTNLDNCDIYMKHSARSRISDLSFCPYEDVLGLAEQSDFESILIPGSGEANFDAYEANPFRSTAALRETNIKRLLEKIPVDMITMDTNTISQVDVPTVEEKIAAKKALKWVKVPKLDLEPRYRMKGKSGSANKFRRKKIMKSDEKREFLRFIRDTKMKEEQQKQLQADQDALPPQILDRFKPKTKKK